MKRNPKQTGDGTFGPVVYLCCAEAAGTATGMYPHMMQRKSVSPAAADPGSGTRLWKAGAAMYAKSGADDTI